MTPGAQLGALPSRTRRPPSTDSGGAEHAAPGQQRRDVAQSII
jgi:hypothetical protein